MRQGWMLLVGWLATSPLLAQEDSKDTTLERGRWLTEQFYAGETETVWERFNGPMREALTSQANLAAFHQQVSEQLGRETERLSERVDPVPPYEVYVRSATFEHGTSPVIVQWTLTEDGQVAGFFIRSAQAAPSSHLSYQTRALLKLPFDGEWLVFWGGRDVTSNYHARAVDQRFAYDFLRVDAGRSYSGEGHINEDYYCFGEPILAPAAGTVLAVENGVADNTPGEMNPLTPLGNYVILDHGEAEYSFFAHFKQGSVTVGKGDQVRSGERLGLCGNSGNSSEPHLHYHLQNTPELFAGEGLPAQFNDYLANESPVERGEPVKGQRIQRLPTDGR